MPTSTAFAGFAPSLLDEPSAALFPDPSVTLSRQVQYYARLEPAEAGSPIRLSTSSWQATIQLDRADFLQTSVPGLTEAQFDAIQTLIDAQAQLTDLKLVVYQEALDASGTLVAQEMVRVDLEDWYRNDGPRNSTLTLSGYRRDVVHALPTPWRSVSGIRTLMRSLRGSSVRCDIDWLLRPGMEARLPDSTVIPVSYINYYVGANEAWMQIGERT